jgi:hypothetical protein
MFITEGIWWGLQKLSHDNLKNYENNVDGYK